MPTHPRWVRGLLSEQDFEAIARVIREAEAGTTAEIRVHLERHVKHRRWGGRADPLDRARRVFAHLGMHRTAERHGVLIYLAVEDHKLAIVGDEGIHGHVGDAYWEHVRDLMIDKLRAGAMPDAIVLGIREVGHALSQRFPRRTHS